MRKDDLLNALLSKYDRREAENICTYYFDCQAHVHSDDFVNHKKQLLAGVPVQYVCNVSFFYGHELYVDNNTLIPRPETEELVHWIISDHKTSAFDLLDVGTGSGCILLSVLHKCTMANGVGLDVDPTIQKVFDINCEKLNVSPKFICADFLNKDNWAMLDSYDVIVSNPPYISHQESMRLGDNVIQYEPHLALFTESDPLIFYRLILEFAKQHLNADGNIYFETNDIYNKEMEELAAEYEYKFDYRKDMQGAWRMLKLWK
jgi:release factor glutamine methyltransferase